MIHTISVLILEIPVVDMDKAVSYKRTRVLIIVMSVRCETSLNLCSVREEVHVCSTKILRTFKRSSIGIEVVPISSIDVLIVDIITTNIS